MEDILKTQNANCEQTDSSEAPFNKGVDCICTTKRGIARHQKLLEVATAAFLKNGYDGASVNEIVKEAGGSLGTLYRLFGNKLGLFEAVLKIKTSELFDDFESEDVWTDDIRTSLLKFGRRLQSVAHKPDGLSLYKIVVAENSIDKQEIQQIFYTHGPQRANRLLSSYLKKQVNCNKMRIQNCDIAANQLLEMIKAPLMKCLLGIETTQEELDTALHQGVDIFLRGTLVNRED
ncbi:TetR/AcrR family transcriptional regulator [Hydrogenovibrio marinus]|uniref:HTH tetR-type domain-containing protein n=1 Tax=Hydrogenovibrio marinus TaxID=28885 RepID=A0A066ZTQ4_HYDMR|nr:TetR/AcrR family transcriptional regulator [Hydrogenovibrio marinus]KDN95654.1 hypothetical protein EI16_04965 [Hydrogenovibrio marinus]